MAKSSKPLGQSISNFLLSILPDSSLGFLGSAYISLVLDNRHSQFENVLYETRINIMRVLKISIHKLQQLETFMVHFPDFFLLILCMNHCSHYVKNEALLFADFQLYLKT